MSSQKSRCYALFLSLALVLAGCPPPDDPPNPDPNPAQRLFEMSYRYGTGNGPYGVAAADFNGDWRQDLVVANNAADTISVLLRRSDGGYEAPADYPAGTEPSAIATEDINGDFVPDVVVANGASDDLSVLFGLPDGTLAAETRYALSTNAAPLDVLIAEVTGDTVLDLVSADFGIGSLSVLPGLGGGLFGSPVRYITGDGPRSVISENLNGDLFPDLITANRNTHDVSVLLGLGGGVFAEAVSYPAGTNPRMAAAARLDAGDTWDLVVSNSGSGDFSVLLGNGDGTFAPNTRQDIDHRPTRFALEDFDGDSNLDIAAILFSDTEALGLVQVIYGDGAAGFGGSRILGAGKGAIDVLATDLDDDTRLDLVTADALADQVSLFYGRGDGSFETEERFAVGRRPRMVAVAEMDDDSVPDLVVANLDSQQISVLLGRGDGTFDPATHTPAGGLPRALAVGKLNRDRHFDVVVTHLNQSRVAVFLGSEDGTLTANGTYPLREAGATSQADPRSIALGDMNGDGKLDAVTGNANRDTVSILLGTGAGAFEAPIETFMANFPLGVNLADLDGDSALDVVCVSTNDPNNANDQADPRVVQQDGVGDGTLDGDSILRFSTGSAPRGITVDDLDGDGDYDAASVHPSDDSVYIGGFGGAFRRRRAGNAPNSVHTGLVNNDGRLDLIVTNDGDEITLLLGTGTLSYSTALTYWIGSVPIEGIVADLDGDSAPDLITANRGSDDVSVLLNAR